ncbi:MAG: WD40 repeat domain-containing protein, partial [Acidobacteriota bacterium]
QFPTALAFVAGVGIGAALLRHPRPEPPVFHRLTFRMQPLGYARFAPDGQTIVYGAEWQGGGATRLFSTRADSTESTALPIRDAELLAISSTGKMAVSFWRRNQTLAEVSLAGGAAREILENVEGADWSPDSQSLAVARRLTPFGLLGKGGRFRLEFPIGKVLYENPNGSVNSPRFAPDGKSIAFVDAGGSIAVADLAGRKATLSTGWDLIFGLAWHPQSDEVWFAGRENSERGYGTLSLYAVSRSGRLRAVLREPANLNLQDISREGRVLLVSSEYPQRIMCLPPGAANEVDLSWLDLSGCADLSEDGKTVLIDEWGSVGARGAVYLRKTDGSPAVRLGEGRAQALSPDGKWAIAIPPALDRLVVLPTGTGETRVLRKEGLKYSGAKWFPDGRRVLFEASTPGHSSRLYLQDLAGGEPRPLTPEGFRVGPVSPDGKFIAARGLDGGLLLYPVDGGEARAVPGVDSDDRVIRWDAKGDALFVAKGGLAPLRIDRLVLATGSREPWREITPADPSNVIGIDVKLTPDGKSYAYSALRELSSLYVVDGLR